MLAEIKQDTPWVENPPPKYAKAKSTLIRLYRINYWTSDRSDDFWPRRRIWQRYQWTTWQSNNLSEILRKQTHIIKSEINNIHLELNQKSQEIANIRQQLNETTKNIESHNQCWSSIIYFRKIRQWANHIDIKLNHLAWSSK